MDLYDSITIPNMFNAVVYVGLLVCIENWRRIRCARHWIYMYCQLIPALSINV